MNNWKSVKEEIREEYNKLAVIPNNVCSERSNMVSAIANVVKRHTNERDRNLFENIDWLTLESESEEPSKGKVKHPILTCKDYHEYMEWINKHNTEPQQGKARFIQTSDEYSPKVLVNPVYIKYIDTNIDKNEKQITRIHLSDHITVSTKLDIDEVIQQLGIEVV